MSDQQESDVKFPEINQNRGETGGGASSTVKSGAMARNESFQSGHRGKSQTNLGQGVNKSAFMAKKERVDVERDAQLLANRIALLKQEEMRTWKKIEETKKRAGEVHRLKERNNQRVQAKIDHMQMEQYNQQQMVEKNRSTKQQNEQEKQKIQAAIQMHRQEQANKAKLEASKDKMRHQQNMQYLSQKNSDAKQQVRIQEQIAKQKMEEAKRRKMMETRIQVQRQIEEEQRIIASKEQEVMKMELLEMELIKKLQNTQAIQKQAYMELEQAIQQKSSADSHGQLYAGGAGGQGSADNANGNDQAQN